MAYYYCFSLGENIDFPEFLQKKFYNISYRTWNFLSNLVLKAFDVTWVYYIRKTLYLIQKCIDY